MLSVVKINVPAAKEHPISNKATIAANQMTPDNLRASTVKKDPSSNYQSPSN